MALDCDEGVVVNLPVLELKSKAARRPGRFRRSTFDFAKMPECPKSG